MEKNRSIRDLIVKSLFIIGIVIVVLILAFSIVRIVPRVFSSFANVGDSVRSPFSRNTLQLEVEKDRVNSGELILISWRYEPIEDGVYEIDFSCTDYLDLELGTSEGNKILECDTIYKLGSSARTISLLPTITRENILADFDFNVKFVNNSGNVLTRDTAKLAVVKRSGDELVGSGSIIETEVIDPGTPEAQERSPEASEPTQAPSESNQTVQSAQSPTPGTTQATMLPDLRIYDVFAADDTTIVFSVANIGSAATGAWYFNYAMPNGNVSSSPLQNSLMPGEAIRYTLRLANIPRGDVAIALDPRNNIQELSVLNNIAVVSVRGGGGSGTRPSDEFADADLEIYNLETGRMSGSRFVEDSIIYENDTAAIRFMVSNIGGRSTGTWRFEVRGLPYTSQNIFESARQSSLQPGETREIIVEFERAVRGNYNIRVELDPRNEVHEESTRNNIDSINLRIR